MPSRAASAPRRRPPRGGTPSRRRSRHDADPVAPDAEQAPGRGRRGRGTDDDRGRVAQDPRPQALAEAGGGARLVDVGQLPRREVEERHDDRQPEASGTAPPAA